MPARRPIPTKLLIYNALSVLKKGTASQIADTIIANYPDTPRDSIYTVIRIMDANKQLHFQKLPGEKQTYQLPKK